MPLVKRAVDGPVSAVQDNIVIFDDSTGKKLKDSGKALSDYVEEGDTRLTDARDPTAHDLDAHGAVTLAELNAVISDATIPSDDTATTDAAGLMSAADKVRLDAMADSANNYAHPNHSGDVTSVADGATTIANDAVTNEKLANMATQTVKGRNTANTGDPEDLDMSTLKTMLDATTTPTASSIPVADANGDIADGWIPATVARLASPTFTGTPAAPTAPKATNTTQLATTAHVKDVLADYVAKTQGATTSATGVVELATTAETSAGQDATRAVTPSGLEYHPSILISDCVYNGVDLETKFAAEIAGYSDVWAWVKARAQAGNFTGLHVGDYVQFTVGADTVQAQIAGMDTYYKTGDPAIGHHIDFISRDCLSATYQWNTTNNNNGNSTNAAPWMVSALKASLDGLVTSLPVGLQSVVVTKRAIIETRYASGSTLTDSTSWAWNDMGKLWVPSEFEVFGSIVWGTKGYSQNGGVQYPIFANSWKSRQKGAGHNGARSPWWLLSVHGGNSAYCCCVTSPGYPNSNLASNASGVPLCFRIR